MIFILPDSSLTAEMYSFEIEGSCLTASWDGIIDADSQEFNASITLLMDTLIAKKITKLLICSSATMYGTLNLEALNIFEKTAPGILVKKIAFLESLDFLWDNNLMQTLNFIKTSASLSTEINSFPTKAMAYKWLMAD